MLAAAHKHMPSSYVSLADTHSACPPANDPHYAYARHLAYARVPGSTLYEEFHPFGTTAYAANDSGIEVSAKRYRYIGKERDEETGLYHCGARYLAAWLGRWTAADPIGLGDGVNRYAYARGNPVRLVDPGGTKGVDPYTSELAQRHVELSMDLATAAGEADIEQISIELEQVTEDIAEHAEQQGRKQQEVKANEQRAREAREQRRLSVPEPEELYEKADVVPIWLASVNPVIGVSALAWEAFYNAPRAADLGTQQAVRASMTGDPIHIAEAIGSGSEALAGFLGVVPTGGQTKTLQKAAGALDDLAKQGTGGATRSFYTVQNTEDAARLRAGGTPWPTGETRAHLGEGAYTFETREAAGAYRETLKGHVPAEVELHTVEMQIAESDLAGLRRVDLRGNDAAAEAFVSKHSRLYGAGEPHEFEHVIRPTAQAAEHFFAAKVFRFFKVLF